MLTQKILATIAVFVLCSSILSGQNGRMLLRSNGQNTTLNPNKNIPEALEGVYVASPEGGKIKHSFHNAFRNSTVIDTLSYNKLFSGDLSSFGFYAHDVMMMWFEAPGDLIIKAAGFSCSETDENINNASISIRLIKLNWTADQLRNVDPPEYMGYYPSENDGMNNAAPFPEEATGEWIDKSEGSHPLPPWESDESDLWSDNGKGVEIIPVEQKDEEGNPMQYSFQWVEMNELGNEPVAKAGEVFAVVINNNGTDWTTGNDRIGFWAKSNSDYPGWKYYEDGRIWEDEPGWWTRQYTWDFAVVVDFFGDIPPGINNVTELKTTFWEDPRPVHANITDINPGGQEAGISVAKIIYTANGSLTKEVEMVPVWDNLFSAYIPTQLRGTEVTYYIEAMDVNGNISESRTYNYKVFGNSSYNFNLVILNGFDESDWIAHNYYFTTYFDQEDYFNIYYNGDYWSYGKVPRELLSWYRNVFEITTNGPLHDNTEVVRDWLESGISNDYLLAGDEWLSFRTEGENTTFQKGSFEYDILGITEAFNDISETDTVSNVFPVQDSYFGGEFYDTMTVNGHTSIDYNPYSVLGLPNKLDGYSVLPSVEADIMAEGKNGNNYIIGSHRSTYDFNNIMFLSFDPLSLEKNPPYDSPSYIWYSLNRSSVFHMAAWEMLIDGSIAGPPAPHVSKVTVLVNTRSTGSRTVRAKITTDYSWYPPDSTDLLYSVNGGDFLSQKMEYAGNDYYSASIPGFPANTSVTYKVRTKVNVDEYEDPEDFISISDSISYMITPFSGAKTLIVFNGFESTYGYPQDYYFIGLGEELYQTFDKLAGEPLTTEVAENYENIFEIFAKEYAFDNKEVIRGWLYGSGSRNYFLSGQYFLKGGSESDDTLFQKGEFEYDVLGLMAGRTDINILDEEADSTTALSPVADSRLGSSMYTHAANSQNDVLYRFDWNEIDGFVAEPGNEVFMKAFGKDNAEYSAGTSRQLEDGNKVIFQSYEPTLVYSTPDDYWYGGSEHSTIVQAYHWFNEVPTDVAEENIVSDFRLSQNYPNPFNPSTVIEYSIPVNSLPRRSEAKTGKQYPVGSMENQSVNQSSKQSGTGSLASVKLVVYDILGREIATLVNGYKRPGQYRVNFNSAKYGMASGIYFYSLKAGTFNISKKMILLK